MELKEKLLSQLKQLITISEKEKNEGVSQENVTSFINRLQLHLEPSNDEEQNIADKKILEGIESSIQEINETGSLAEFIRKNSKVVEVRPEELVCDVVRFQNNKEKWVALVGLLNGKPYEIFTGLQDDDEGIVLPKTVTSGKIIKRVNSDGTKRYDFQFENRRGYKTTVEGLSEKFNPEYWNYAKLISGILRYRMPIENVIKLVGSMQMKSESINTWKNGVERALKKYTNDNQDSSCEAE